MPDVAPHEYSPTGCCLEILGHRELSSTPPSLPLLVYTFSHHFLLLSSSASKLLVQTGMGWKCNGWRPYEMGTVLYFKKEISHLLFKVMFFKIPVTNWMVLTFLDAACTIYCILDFFDLFVVHLCPALICFGTIQHTMCVYSFWHFFQGIQEMSLGCLLSVLLCRDCKGGDYINALHCRHLVLI